MVKPSYVDSNGITKGAWSKEEDSKLIACIEKCGNVNWRLLPQYAGLARSGKSCRLRWVNYLKPGVKRGKYSKEEKDLIIELHAKLGNKWSAIAKNFPGRTDNDVKNYWNGHIRKSKQGKAADPTDRASNIKQHPSEDLPLQAGAEKLSEIISPGITVENESSPQREASLRVQDSGSSLVQPLSNDTISSDSIQGNMWNELMSYGELLSPNPYILGGHYRSSSNDDLLLQSDNSWQIEECGLFSPYFSYYDDYI